MQTDWNPILRQEFNKAYWIELQNYILDQRASHMVFPAHPDVFRAFHLTSFATLKVVILGQDPYHGVGQANGLCFSVSPGVSFPPSLQNIFKELEDDLGISKPQSGDLAAWAEQGILLLNTTLTVRQGAPASHQGKGWETFTDEVIRCISQTKEKIVFVLWGASARRKKSLIDVTKHTCIESAHPSPLSAYRGFFGSKPFSRINQLLRQQGITEIDWSL
ncbi:MAG: uracil-DNA glycosylase [Acidimicrobiaceae bacterium]|nr:uracil-DNA glycosylase [Acidimicrobiaceae bacterium]